MVNGNMEMLENLVNSRKKEAVRKDLGNRVLKVSTLLGKKIYSAREHCSTIYSEEGDFKASYERFLNEVSVNYKGKLVFSQEFQLVGGSINMLRDWVLVGAYIPGEWEDKLDKAYEKVLKLEARREIRRYKPRREHIKEAFAL